MDVRTKRVYEPADPADGTRVLVDRLWPRGVSKLEAKLDLWDREVAPSTELRKTWHADPQGHDPAHYEAFETAYRAELAQEPAFSAVNRLVELARSSGTLTLLYGSRDQRVNHAVVLREVLLARAAAAQSARVNCSPAMKGENLASRPKAATFLSSWGFSLSFRPSLTLPPKKASG